MNPNWIILGLLCNKKLNCPVQTVECWREVNCGGNNELVRTSIKVTCLDADKNQLPAPPLDDVSMMDLMRECNEGSSLHEFNQFDEFKTEHLQDQLEALKEKFKDLTAGLLDGKIERFSYPKKFTYKLNFSDFDSGEEKVYEKLPSPKIDSGKPPCLAYSEDKYDEDGNLNCISSEKISDQMINND